MSQCCKLSLSLSLKQIWSDAILNNTGNSCSKHWARNHDLYLKVMPKALSVQSFVARPACVWHHRVGPFSGVSRLQQSTKRRFVGNLKLSSSISLHHCRDTSVKCFFLPLSDAAMSLWPCVQVKVIDTNMNWFTVTRPVWRLHAGHRTDSAMAACPRRYYYTRSAGLFITLKVLTTVCFFLK